MCNFSCCFVALLCEPTSCSDGGVVWSASMGDAPSSSQGALAPGPDPVSSQPQPIPDLIQRLSHRLRTLCHSGSRSAHPSNEVILSSHLSTDLLMNRDGCAARYDPHAPPNPNKRVKSVTMVVLFDSINPGSIRCFRVRRFPSQSDETIRYGSVKRVSLENVSDALSSHRRQFVGIRSVTSMTSVTHV